MAAVAGTVGDWPLGPRQPSEPGVAARLVRFDGQQVVRAATVEVLGGQLLGVQHVGGDDRIRQLEGVQ